MKTLTISTHRKDEIVDITDRVEAYLHEAHTENGVCTVFVAHTTSAITTADLIRHTHQIICFRRLLGLRCRSHMQMGSCFWGFGNGLFWLS